MNERQLFIDALEKESLDERRAYLDLACGGDSQLRSCIEVLLRSHAEGASLLDHPVLGEHPAEGFFGDTDGIQSEPPVNADIDLGFLEASAAPDQLGRLGHYEILEVVGRGGMGIVLKVHDTRLHRVVAVKVLAPELAANPIARKRFLREAQAAAAVSHDHVVTIHAVEGNESAGGDAESSRRNPPYLVMEFVDGQSLQEKIAQAGQLELREILRIGRQIAAALAAAHAQGLVHRDVKPSNILLQNGIERVKVTDFGLARAADDVGITRPGEIAGTPQYMSPEQAQGQPVDARSDLFSLGSVLYGMCTGRSPFRAPSTVAVLRRVCDDVPRPIREVNPDIPDWLVAIVERLLTKDRSERFQTATEVAELLGRHLAHVQDPHAAPLPSALSPAAPRGSDWRRVLHSPLAGKRSGVRGHRRWAVAAALLLAVATGLGVTEATGVTQLSATVVRIVTGEGTLVIEVDDPRVQVTLDGEELRITGAGLQEIRLRPGQYQFRATVDGEPIRQELVTISRGGRQVVGVTVESAPALRQQPGARQSPASEGVPIDHVRLANEHAAHGRLDAAAVEFSAALSLLVDPNVYGIERVNIVEQFTLSDELFERVVKLRPQDINLWSHRAHHLAKVDRLEESAACFQKRLDLGPDGAGLWQAYAIALLGRNDDAYHTLCEKMLVAFANCTDPGENAWAAMTLAIVPDSVKDKQRAFQMAERAVNGLSEEVWW